MLSMRDESLLDVACEESSAVFIAAIVEVLASYANAS